MLYSRASIACAAYMKIIVHDGMRYALCMRAMLVYAACMLVLVRLCLFYNILYIFARVVAYFSRKTFSAEVAKIMLAHAIYILIIHRGQKGNYMYTCISVPCFYPAIRQSLFVRSKLKK